MNQPKLTIIIIVVPVIFFILFVFVYAPTLSSEQFREMSKEELAEIAVSWTWEDLVRDTDKYDDEILNVSGNVYLNTEDNMLIIPVERTGDSPLKWKYVVVEEVFSGFRILEGDEVFIYGYVRPLNNVADSYPYDNPSPILRPVYFECSSC